MTRRFALLLPLLLAACGHDSAEKPTTGDTTGSTTDTPSNGTTTGGTTESFDGPQVAYRGRFVQDPTDPNTSSVAWSGASILTRFVGTSVSIGLSTASNSNVYFHVSVDDNTPTTLRLSAGAGRYTVQSPDPQTAHTVRWTKITEATFGSVTVDAPVPSSDGKLLPTPTPSGRRIEFVGDSITAGYGVLGVYPCSGTSANEDADKAYPALVGRAFAADYMQLGFSGKGAYYNADCTSQNVVADLYDYAIPPQVENANTVLWDATAYAPDVIVVNVGTNDFGAASSSKSCNTETSNNGMPVASTYVSAYVSLLQKVTTAHPNAYVIVVYGPMLTADQMQTDAGYLQSVMNQLNNANVQLLAVGPQGTARACDSHPNADTHAQVAQALVTAIEALPLHWTADS